MKRNIFYTILTIGIFGWPLLANAKSAARHLAAADGNSKANAGFTLAHLADKLTPIRPDVAYHRTYGNTSTPSLGNALNFDGTDDYVKMDNNGVMLPGNNWSVEFLIYTIAKNPFIDGERTKVLDGGDPTGVDTKKGKIYAEARPISDRNGDFGYYEITMGVFDENANYDYSATMNAGQWNHLAMTCDGKNISFYANGVLYGQSPVSNSSTFNKANMMFVGGNPNQKTYSRLSIDELRFWDYARTVDEINKNIAIPADPQNTHLIAYYNFDQGVGNGNNAAITTLSDIKGNYNGTLNNLALTGTSSNFVTSDLMMPATPQAQSATNIDYGSFDANWTLPSGTTADAYFLDVSTDQTFNDGQQFILQDKSVGNVTTYKVSNLTDAKTYYYRVRAVKNNAKFKGANSNVIPVSTLTSTNAPAVIQLASTDTKTYGVPDYKLAVSSSSTGAFSYTVIPKNIISISTEGDITVYKAGTVSIVVEQTADANYGHAGPVTQTLVINKKAIIAHVQANHKKYDGLTTATLDEWSTYFDGTGPYDYPYIQAASITFNDKNVGNNKTVTVSNILLDSDSMSKFTIGEATSTANITKAQLLVTADSQTKTEGDDNPTLTLSYKGFVNGETVAIALTTEPTLTTSATKTTEAGTYTINASGGVAAYNNYDFLYFPGTLTIASKINTAPTIDAIPNQSICATTDSHTINLSGITPGSEPLQTTSLSVTSNNQGLFNTLSITSTANGTGSIIYSLKSGATGTANIIVAVQDNGGTKNGGIDTYSISFTININTLPVISIVTSTGITTITKGDKIDLTANAPGATQYTWATAKGILSGQNTAKLTIQPTERTTYTVTVSNAASCTLSKQITIEVMVSTVLTVNNILTPNGDGVNDRWVIKNIEEHPNATVKVYDQSGRLIFSQKNYDNKWDGTYKGKVLEKGTYYYVIDSDKGVYKGYLSVINK